MRQSTARDEDGEEYGTRLGDGRMLVVVRKECETMLGDGILPLQNLSTVTCPRALARLQGYWSATKELSMIAERKENASLRRKNLLIPLLFLTLMCYNTYV